MTQRWDPWTEVMTLREAMGRLLEDSYVRPSGGSSPVGANMQPLALDVYEDADNIEVSACLPGLRPEDVDITLQGDTLTIKGQRKQETTERKQGNYLMREQRGGSYYRSIQLPMLIDGDKVQANFQDGVLRLTLPKAASTKPRQIRIGGGNGQASLTEGETVAQGGDGQREQAQQPETAGNRK